MNVYQIVTEKILASMEAGVVPWQKPWGSRLADRPMTGEGKSYRGMNVLMLSIAKAIGKYKSNCWITFNFARNHGGSVRKGEKGSMVVFWKFVDRKDQDSSDDNEDRSAPMLRYYTVFNVEQTDGVVLPKKTQALLDEANAPSGPVDMISTAESVLEKTPVKVETVFGGDKASYSPGEDRISMPTRDRFDDLKNFYSTYFHELAHATGHESRLARPGIVKMNGFGTHEYGREELVAEIASAMVGSTCGVDVVDTGKASSAGYIQHWMKAIEADPRMVVVSASQAQKAADLILGEVATFEEKEEV